MRDSKQYLVLDFGNTWQKCALIRDTHIDVHTYSNIALEDIQSLVEGESIDGVILSSVIHYSNEIRLWLQGFNFVELDAQTRIPIINRYKTPKTLGKDRLAAAIGASSAFPNQNVLAIDCGTAIKYDFVNANGEYLGGGISPGLYLRFKALHTFTDKLPLVAYSSVPPLIGADTIHAISSGVINGAISEVDGMINRYKERFSNLNIVLTGGEMIYFVESLKNAIFADPNLVLKGLHQILLFNEDKSI